MSVCILYAAKSTADPRGSIPRQLADCRAAAEREGRQIVGEYSDEAASAYKGNRGQGLSDAKDHAIRVGGEIWVQHSDRLARGDGVNADHLAEVWFALRRHGVRLRSVQDDSNLEDAIRVVLIGERNYEDSKRKSEATQAGMRRAAERGQWVGGIVPDGYRAVREVDAHGNKTARLERDPERAPIFDLIWRLAREGWSARAIVLELDKRGIKTNPRKRDARERPFEAVRIRNTLSNRLYAGRSMYKGEDVGEAQWPAFVTVEEFDRIAAEREQRTNRRPERQPAGRPPAFLLSRVATCGVCGAEMYGVTDSYLRKDGSRARRYTCKSHREHAWRCAAKPVDAVKVDRAVVENLTLFLGDIGLWRDRLTQGRSEERERLQGEVDRAQTALADEDRRIGLLTSEWERWLGDDAVKAEIALESLTRRRAERERASNRLTAAQDALASVPVEVDTDPLIDFFNDLRVALSERVANAHGDVQRLNMVIREYFDALELTEDDRGVWVRPVFTERGRALHEFGGAVAESPPARQFQAHGNPPEGS